MIASPQESWRHIFARSAEWRRQEAIRFDRKTREDADRKKDGAQSDLSDLIDMAALASTADIASFTERLDTYDVATIEALEANRLALEDVQQRIDDKLERAYVLPDGRRAFKTQNGLQVFDEHGEQVHETVIDPDMIGKQYPEWEEFKEIRDARERFESERTEILDYQEKLDAARERLDESGLTKDDLDALEDDLDMAMPDAVRRQLPDYVAPEPAPDLGRSFGAVAPNSPAADVSRPRLDGLSL